MDETTSFSIGTVTKSVKSTTNLSLVLGMAKNGTKFSFTMSKLTFRSISTESSLFKRSAEFRFVEVLLGDLLFNLKLSLLCGQRLCV